MPQFAVLIYAADSAHDPHHETAAKRQCDDHAAELVVEGTMTYAWALTPRELATSIRAGGTTPGPFRGDGPVVAGFYLLEAPNLEAAVAIASQNPAIAAGGGVEVRPVHSGGPVS